MPIITTGVANLLIVLAIGIAAGLFFNRYGQTWLRRQFATRHSDVTSALVGIAGAFMGFHVGVIMRLLPAPRFGEVGRRRPSGTGSPSA